MGLCFATNNNHKLAEVQALLPPTIELVSLKEIRCFEEIPETADTIEGNAIQKANYIWSNFNIDCFADDTGLEVKALGGAPGVFSARYAGPTKDNQANCNKLIQELASQTDRQAQFRTVVCLILEGNQYLFEGIAKGEILIKPQGDKGFGYDPLFMPANHQLSFAQMSTEEKNAISHRSIAVNQLVDFLKEH